MVHEVESVVIVSASTTFKTSDEDVLVGRVSNPEGVVHLESAILDGAIGVIIESDEEEV